MIGEIGIYHYMILSAILFSIGACGLFIVNRSIIIVLISIELMLLAVNINFISFSVFLNDIVGQIFVLFILGVAAAEVAIGFAIIICYYRHKEDISMDSLSNNQED